MWTKRLPNIAAFSSSSTKTANGGRIGVSAEKRLPNIAALLISYVSPLFADFRLACFYESALRDTGPAVDPVLVCPAGPCRPRVTDAQEVAKEMIDGGPSDYRKVCVRGNVVTRRGGFEGVELDLMDYLTKKEDQSIL